MTSARLERTVTDKRGPPGVSTAPNAHRSSCAARLDRSVYPEISATDPAWPGRLTPLLTHGHTQRSLRAATHADTFGRDRGHVMDRLRRATWVNHTGNQSCEPLQLCTPEDLDDVIELIDLATKEGLTLRAVGSGHSWSDVALTDGLLLQPHKLSSPLGLEGRIREHWRARHLVRVEGGMRIRELNEYLEQQGLALENLGGYDAQTVAGVISTSTHGSGLAYGPLSDAVRSLDIVTSGEDGPRRLRIEPQNGPTEQVPDGERWHLARDDSLFYAAAVGMGCMGVIYGVTLEVCPKFRLDEVREVSTWEKERDQLPNGKDLRGTDHWELFVNPYAGADGTHKCLVTKRTRTPADADPAFEDRYRPLIPEFLSSIPVITPFVLNAILDLDPEGTTQALDFPIERLRDKKYTDRSYNVFNIGAANLVPAYSSEIGIPLVGDKPRRAVERIFEIAEKRARIGDAWHSSPFALRFVKRSPCFLSMMHGTDTMMIELIMQKDTEGGFELLAEHENALYELGGRPHWGQVNVLTESAVRALYPSLKAWTDAHEYLNHGGVFDSPFTQRVGLSRPVVQDRSP